jgi:hypothetical protein
MLTIRSESGPYRRSITGYVVLLKIIINLDMLVATASPARTALKTSQLIRHLPDDVTLYVRQCTSCS